VARSRRFCHVIAMIYAAFRSVNCSLSNAREALQWQPRLLDSNLLWYSSVRSPSGMRHLGCTLTRSTTPPGST
jgi:hypothetical protein